MSDKKILLAILAVTLIKTAFLFIDPPPLETFARTAFLKLVLKN